MEKRKNSKSTITGAIRGAGVSKPIGKKWCKIVGFHIKYPTVWK